VYVCVSIDRLTRTFGDRPVRVCGSPESVLINLLSVLNLICLSTPIYLSIYLSTPIYLSIYLSTPIYLSIYLSTPIYLSIYLSTQ